MSASKLLPKVPDATIVGNGNASLDLGQIGLGEPGSRGKLLQGDPFELAQPLEAPEGVGMGDTGRLFHIGYIVS